MQEDENVIFNSFSHYADKYLQYASSVISSYNGSEPFHLFIKKYFSVNKKHGSRDRKLISALCYNYFRVCMGVNKSFDIKEKISAGNFLCETTINTISGLLVDEWKPFASAGLQQKLDILKNDFYVEKIFPFINEVSEQITHHSFQSSFLLQPKVFIRIRPGNENTVIKKLSDSNIGFEKLSDACLSFSNNKNISDVVSIDKEAVIQDYNSQRALNALHPLFKNYKEKIKVWDCCAGSGGKALLAYDTFENLQLTVSDIRRNILNNLKLRFDTAAIKNYSLVEIDLQFPTQKVPPDNFDVVIADVPCSGSGTWQRTPEQLYFFKEKEIKRYASLQKTIIKNALQHVKHSGYLLYVTCSVFKKENEENVLFFKNEYNLTLVQEEYLKGYEMQADTLFAALFQKS